MISLSEIDATKNVNYIISDSRPTRDLLHLRSDLFRFISEQILYQISCTPVSISAVRIILGCD
jgi:hypothetical protein